jgi:hypothetical protein
VKPELQPGRGVDYSRPHWPDKKPDQARAGTVEKALEVEDGDIVGAALNILAPIAVGSENVFEPANDASAAMSPVRAGAVRLTRLRIVDAFGQYRDVDLGCPIVPQRLRRDGDPGVPELPARLAQPSRLRMRWLPGDDEGPALALYAADGSALGSLIPELRRMLPPPGDAAPLEVLNREL